MSELSTDLFCPLCQEEIDVTTETVINDYFSGKTYLHSLCGNTLQWWDVIVWNLNTYRAAPILIDTKSKSFVTTVTVGDSQKLDLDELKIPLNAHIFDISFSALEQNIVPVEIWRQSSHVYEHKIPRQIEIYALPLEGLPIPVNKGRVIINVLWIPYSQDDITLQQLISACNWHYRQQFQEMIIPANVAVEASLTKLLTSYFISQKISNKRVEDFLTNGATYSHQLNVVLPILARLHKAPLFSDGLRGKLNTLRDLRNDLAHRGQPRPQTGPLTQQKSSELLAASLLTFHYLSQILAPIFQPTHSPK